MDNLQLSLEDMGFSKARVEKALKQTGNKTIEAAMDWLIEHEDDPDADGNDDDDIVEASTAPKPVQPPLSPMEESSVEIVFESNKPEHISSSTSVLPKPPVVTGSSTQENASIGDHSPPSVSVPSDKTEENVVAHSFKCEECGKLFRNSDEVEFHAVKSGHSNFSESTEMVKALSEDERKQRIQDLQEKLKAKREKVEAEDKQKAKEMEFSRRKSGQDFQAARHRIEEEEMKKIAEDRKRQKREDLITKQRILDQIKLDREAQKKNKQGGDSQSSAEASAIITPKPVAAQPSTNQPQQTKNYEETKINIRLLNGTVMNQTFQVKEPLSAVRLYIDLYRTDGDLPFTMMTNYPKKVFTDEDMEKPLKELGLVPSAVIILTRKV